MQQLIEHSIAKIINICIPTTVNGDPETSFPALSSSVQTDQDSVARKSV